MPAGNWDDDHDEKKAQRDREERDSRWWSNPAVSYEPLTPKQRHEDEMDRLFGKKD